MLSFNKSTIFTSIVAITAQAITIVSSPTQTSLPALASQVPSCVAGCLGVVHEGIGCDAGDIVCLCENKASLISKVGLCIVGAQCGSEDATGSTDIVQDICDLVAENPGTAMIASASKVLDAVVASATVPADRAPTSTNAAGSVAYDVLKVVVVVGAAAAFAI